MTLTPEEGRRLHVLTLLEGRRISPGQAAEALGYPPAAAAGNGRAMVGVDCQLEKLREFSGNDSQIQADGSHHQR